MIGENGMDMELSRLREQIDNLDSQLAPLLERRLDVAADIARYKKDRGLAVLDASRETEKLAAIRAMCRPDTGDALCQIYQAILAASRAWQTDVMEGPDER